jgi:hypothetical protein
MSRDFVSLDLLSLDWANRARALRRPQGLLTDLWKITRL